MPSIDSMFLARRPIHHHIRPLQQKKATPKWYRAVYRENLTGWSERRRGIPRRCGSRESLDSRLRLSAGKGRPPSPQTSRGWVILFRLKHGRRRRERGGGRLGVVGVGGGKEFV